MAKMSGGQWLLRLDDLDTPRQIPGIADDIMRTLESFSLLWDGKAARQSRHVEDYQRAFAALQQLGVIYPCGCSRKEIASIVSAPHVDDDCIPYYGTCRNGINGNSHIRSWRVSVPEKEVCFNDLRMGRFCQKLTAVSGDFVVKRGDGGFAYQLAVVVDDGLAGVNQVVRGDDLLASTPRQIYVQGLLGFQQPDYCHLPLVTDSDGSKLSKRDNLISQQLGNVVGREQKLLVAVLGFLGQCPPVELVEYPCSTILEWGVSHFKPLRLPAMGGVLGI